MSLWRFVAASFKDTLEDKVAVKFFDSNADPAVEVNVTYRQLLKICDSVLDVLKEKKK